MELKHKTHRFVVRLPLQLQTDIADAARQYRRSMNSEIVARLEQSFSGLPGHCEQANELEIASYVTQPVQPLFDQTLTEDEEHLIRAMRKLPHSKRQALLELLR